VSETRPAFDAPARIDPTSPSPQPKPAPAAPVAPIDNVAKKAPKDSDAYRMR
jgi:hypothetical protein